MLTICKARPGDTLLPYEAGALFSACGAYRFSLWRVWDTSKPYMMMLMLNPSTATHLQNDPTIERCERRAQEYQYGGLYVGNIFALRSTDPAALYTADDPIGPANDAHILEMTEGAGIVLCGWGKHGAHMGRGAAVEKMLRERSAAPKLHVLRLNKDGTPQHPLYIGYDVKPTRW